MPTLNPKWAAVLSIVLGVVGLLGLGTVPFPDYVPKWLATDITQTCLWLSAVGNLVAGYLHLTSPAVPGPFGKRDVTK